MNGLDDNIRKFKEYVLGEGDFDELDFKEAILQSTRQLIREQRAEANREGIESALRNLLSIEYPPSGKTYYFTEREWDNNLQAAIDRVEALTDSHKTGDK